MDAMFFSHLVSTKIYRYFRSDCDFSDRLNCNVTAYVICIFSIIISMRQFIGKPISCWVPNEFTASQVDYCENHCWVQSTYYLPYKSPVPENVQERMDRAISIHYYQWIPFILLFQAMCFCLPSVVWQMFNWQSGIHVKQIMEIVCDVDSVKDSDSRKGMLQYVARYIKESLESQRHYRSNCLIRCKQTMAQYACLWCGRRYGNYLIYLYMFTKTLYLGNAVSQFFLMNKFLGTNYSMYGLELVLDLAKGHEWHESGVFPRISMCDFQVRRFANTHRYTVQCVLPINLFAEKIFIFLWFWFVVVTIFTSLSYLQWFYRMNVRKNRIEFIKKFLFLTNNIGKRDSIDKKAIIEFIDRDLRYDGVFLLRLIASNAGELTAAEVTANLWKSLRKPDKMSNNAKFSRTSLPDGISEV